MRTLVARGDDGQALAAVPLVRKRHPLEAGRVAGGYWPFRSFPIATDAGDEEIAAMLRDRGVRRALGPVWRLGPVLATDPTIGKLERAATQAGWTMLSRRLGTCFEIDVKGLQASGPWPRGSSLKKHRWREKGLREEGELAYRHVTGARWRGANLDAVAAIESRCWLAQREGGADTQLNRPEQRRFWEQVARDPVIAPMLFCSIMTVGDVPAAFSFGMEVGRVRYQIANNYDPRFARHSPGRVLLTHDFQQAAERGIERISWGSGDAGYKSAMGAQPGPAILDLLFVRPALLALPLRRLWTGSFSRAGHDARGRAGRATDRYSPPLSSSTAAKAAGGMIPK
jgi:CelD/BcsL family acetyltransferase involved in cellulose biosynthesis